LVVPSERAEGLRHLQPELSDLGERLPGGRGCITEEEAAVSHARLVGFAGLVNELGTIRIAYFAKTQPSATRLGGTAK